MPPKRRSGGGPASSTRSAAQSTLSFSTKKDVASRVTKSSAAAPSAPSKDLNKKLNAIESGPLEHAEDKPEVQVISPPAEDVTEGKEKIESVKAEGVKAEIIALPSKPVDVRSEKEREAEGISDSQVQRYWKKEEDSRRAPRVHQANLSVYEKILRHFDLSSQYGPCIGISRLKRWKRAESLGLHPPIEVLAVLIKLEEDEKKEERKSRKRTSGGSVHSNDDLNGEWRRAYVDELMDGTTGALE